MKRGTTGGFAIPATVGNDRSVTERRSLLGCSTFPNFRQAPVGPQFALVLVSSHGFLGGFEALNTGGCVACPVVEKPVLQRLHALIFLLVLLLRLERGFRHRTITTYQATLLEETPSGRGKPPAF
jgi:hypothetical protein